MAKSSPEILAKARALFEAGKSLREIETATNVNYVTLSRLAKKEGWKKGELKQLVSSMARNKAHFETLEAVQKETVSELADSDAKRILNFKSRRDKIAELAYDRIESELLTCEVQHVKPLIEAADKAGVMVEIAPRFNPNATTINNTNAQQNNTVDAEQDAIIKRVLYG